MYLVKKKLTGIVTQSQCKSNSTVINVYPANGNRTKRCRRWVKTLIGFPDFRQTLPIIYKESFYPIEQVFIEPVNPGFSFHFSPRQMSTAYGKIPKPSTSTDLDTILPIPKFLRDGTQGYIQKVDSNNESLIGYLYARFNAEIEEGYIKMFCQICLRLKSI